MEKECASNVERGRHSAMHFAAETLEFSTSDSGHVCASMLPFSLVNINLFTTSESPREV